MAAPNISQALSGRSLEFKNQQRRRRRNRPESGRIAAASVSVGAAIPSPSALASLSSVALFSAQVVLVLGAEGVIFSVGDASDGALAAVYDDNLIIRAGSALAPLDDQTARIVVPLTSLGRDKRVKLSWKFTPSTTLGLLAEAWSDGRQIGSSRSVVPNPVWAGDGAGGFGALGAIVPQEPDEVLQAYTSNGGALTAPLFLYI